MMKMKNNTRPKRKLSVFVVILVILAVAEIIAAYFLDEWESSLKYDLCSSEMSLTYAEWIPDTSDDELGKLLVTIENHGSIACRELPSVNFDSGSFYAHAEPIGYYDKVNSANVKNYSFYECIPPGENKTIEYYLEENDAIELEALLRKEEEVYAVLPSSISQESSKCIIEIADK